MSYQAWIVFSEIVGPMNWHPTLSLLPLCASLMTFVFIWRIAHLHGFAQFVMGAPIFVAWLIACYIGGTGILAALDMGSVYDANAYIAFAMVVAQGCVAFLFVYFLVPPSESETEVQQVA